MLLTFYACNPHKTETKEKKLQDYLTIKHIINTEQPILKKACLNCLAIVGQFQLNNSTVWAFIDYHPGIIYIYDTLKKSFITRFKIPKHCYIADVFKVYSLDSILYFNNNDHLLTVCDTNKIKHEYSTNQFTNDSNLLCLNIQNKLKSYKNKFVFNLALDCNDATIENYNESLSNISLIGFFELKKNILYYTPTHLYRQEESTDEKHIVDNNIVYFVNEQKNEIVFSHKCSNPIFVYNILTKKVSKYDLHNSNHKLYPIYYSQNSNEGKNYYEAANQQNNCSILLFDDVNNYILRVIYTNTTNSSIKKRFLQVIDSKYNLIAELEIPKEYIWVVEHNKEILLYKFDKKKQQIVYEKFTYTD